MIALISPDLFGMFDRSKVGYLPTLLSSVDSHLCPLSVAARIEEIALRLLQSLHRSLDHFGKYCQFDVFEFVNVQTTFAPLVLAQLG